MTVDKEAARKAIETQIAAPLGLSVEDAALGILRIAVANMGRAIRAVSTEKGHRLSDFALFAYGGAGPLHAAAVAVETGMKSVLVPAQPGTMCARGILLSDVGFDFVRTGVSTASAEEWPQITAAFEAMTKDGDAWLDGEGIPPKAREMQYVVDARYDGQNHEVQVVLDGIDTAYDTFLDGFRAAHRQEYGYDIADRAVEIVNLRLSVKGASGADPDTTHMPEDADPVMGKRQVYFDSGWFETTLYDRAKLPVNQVITGPAIVQEMSSTTIVEPGLTVHVDATGTMIIEV
jgi:N-methylhydantoinase A